MTPDDIATMRAYLRQWVGSGTWDRNPYARPEDRAALANLRSLVDAIRSREAINTFLHICTELGMDPL